MPQREVPKHYFLGKLLRKPFPKEGLFSMKNNIDIGANPAKFMHEESGPSPSSLGLNSVPRLMFNRLACIKEAKRFLEMDVGAMWIFHSLTVITLCQINHIIAASFPKCAGSHTWVQYNLY